MSFAFEAEISTDLGSSGVSESLVQLERMSVDGRGIFLSYCLNIHAALLGIHDAQSLVLSVVQEGQVDLTVDVNTFMDQHRLYGQTFLRGLVGDQVVANHSFSLFAHDLGSLHNVDAALHAGSQVTLTATASLHLGFHDEAPLVAQTLRDLKRLFRGASQHALLNVDSVLAHQLFRVVFVQIEEPGGQGGQGRPHTKGVLSELEGV